MACCLANSSAFCSNDQPCCPQPRQSDTFSFMAFVRPAKATCTGWSPHVPASCLGDCQSLLRLGFHIPASIQNVKEICYSPFQRLTNKSNEFGTLVSSSTYYLHFTSPTSPIQTGSFRHTGNTPRVLHPIFYFYLFMGNALICFLAYL